MKTAQTMAVRPIHKVWGTTNTDQSQQPQQKGEMWMEKGSVIRWGRRSKGERKRLEDERAGQWTQGISKRQNRRKMDDNHKKHPLHWKTTEGKKSTKTILRWFKGCGIAYLLGNLNERFLQGKKVGKKKKCSHMWRKNIVKVLSKTQNPLWSVRWTGLLWEQWWVNWRKGTEQGSF